MKSYPEISYRTIGSMYAYAFDKIDGSNIRGEWGSKKGFWKFGTRNRLLDQHDIYLGSAPLLIKEKYEDDLSRIFRKLKIGKCISFFEYWGENSFAGNHEDEEHTVTLIDVNPFKRGILEPKLFIKHFGNLDIPNVLYSGKINKQFINSVRNRTLDGMTFEGVVCKGIHKNIIKMFKIKSIDWIMKVKDYFGYNPVLFNKLVNKCELELIDSYRKRRFCPSCFRSGSLSSQCICGNKTVEMDYDAQPPRKNSSKKRWKDFFREWYSNLNFEFYWKERFK